MSADMSAGVTTASKTHGAQAGAGLQDAALFYFVDAKLAADFVERFACGLIVGRDNASPSDAEVTIRHPVQSPEFV